MFQRLKLRSRIAGLSQALFLASGSCDVSVRRGEMGSDLILRFRCKTPGRLRKPGSPFFGSWLGRLQSDQVQFAAVEQFPLDGFASL